MEKRLPLFMLLAVGILVGSQLLMHWINPPKPVGKQADKGKGTVAVVQSTATIAAAQGTGTVAVAQGTGPTVATIGENVSAVPSEPDPKLPEQFVTLGSLDPQQPYRMLVTITNRGAAVVRAELNQARFRDQDDEAGYLGHLLPVDAKGGARVQVVGPGTPAAVAGLKVDDVITAVGNESVSGAADLLDKVRKHRPRENVDLAVLRSGQKLTVTAALIRRPLELIRPEWETSPVDLLSPSTKHDPLSMLLTLSQAGEEKIESTQQELPGVGLYDVNWEITDRGPDFVELSRKLPQRKLTVIKRYQLAEVPAESIGNQQFKAYHVMVGIEIRRDDDTPIEVAYQLSGPNGLPTEGWWYLNKISRGWGGAGMRDVAVHVEGRGPDLIPCKTVAEETKTGKPTFWDKEPLAYVGVDTPYFSAILIPQKKIGEKWHRRIDAVGVGTLPRDPNDRRHNIRLTNVSCKLTSETTTISREKPLKHEYQLFAGPKQRDLLSQYGPPKETDSINLAELIYYGWQPWAACAMILAHVLHFFYSFLGNYALAIILLTVMVKTCMLPLSRKQALGAQKVQELQPEMKKISEKYKDDLEKKTKALQDLYRKHNYHPLSGCLPMLIQMPIFIGLYKALAIDIELRQAPLISEGFGWATNLAAPDKLFRWDAFMPGFVVSHVGPYFNLLPILTVGLFIWQQKMFMPPPADENAAMQQKMMKYMMIFMGYMFFTVPSGLCLYFIVSSLWGIAERKLLPKAAAASAAAMPASTVIDSKVESPAAARRRKRRNKG
ncbi:MAG: YidC/Oxa1 family insertase periplasmic-domain containing protein [Planctomycetes bacterium]|nr:YidC/Oxa1 family insertase periplasmic-domain containing protein [Planctomycetota bacterium]